MNIKVQQKEKKNTILIVVLVFLILVGDAVAFENIRVFGLVLSAYRIFIPCLSIYLLACRIYQKKLTEIFKEKMLICYLAMMLFWIAWGTILLAVSPYCNVHNAIKELLALILGMAGIYCFFELCQSEKYWDTIIRLLRITGVVLCVWSLVEILAGVYIPTSSRYWGDAVESSDWMKFMMSRLGTDSVYLTTTFFFNVNDYSAFLALFMPLFYLDERCSRRENIGRGVMLLLITFILSINDSNIVIIAIFLSMALYVILKKGSRKYAGGMLGGLAVWYIIGSQLLCSFLIAVKSMLPIVDQDILKKYEDILFLLGRDKLALLGEVVNAQLANAANGMGSLYVRIMITISSLKMVLKTKFMGIGPAGFTNYIKRNEKDSKLLDPHNWWMEIMAQYGVIVFALYFLCTAVLCIKIYLLYKKNGERKLLLFLCVAVTFCIVCVAPSNYLKFSYQWLIPSVGIVLLKYSSESQRSDKPLKSP